MHNFFNRYKRSTVQNSVCKDTFFSSLRSLDPVLSDLELCLLFLFPGKYMFMATR